MSMHDAALQWVQHGFKVLPCSDAKVPLTAHGLKDATGISLGVDESWGKWPEANIAIVTDGLIVLDFDSKSGGLESLARMRKVYDFPATRVHRTGGGGYHYLYRNPDGSDIRNKVGLAGWLGVDVRANGGYVIVPPSRNGAGRYEVKDKADIAPAPAWLLDLCAAPATTRLAGPSEAGVAIPAGQRNQTLASLGGSMRRRGMSEPAIAAALQAENTARCQPPLTEKEVETIARSVSHYAPDPLAQTTEITEQTEKTDRHYITTEQTEVTEHTEQSGKTLNFLNRTEQELKNTEQAEQDAGGRGLDHLVWRLVDSWLTEHVGESFDLDTICRHLDLRTREARQSVSKKLAYEVGREQLKKSAKSRPPLYTLINRSLVYVSWNNVTVTSNSLQLRWPRGRDGTMWGFDGRIEIPPGGLVVVAGVTNTGKSNFCRNFLWENMDGPLPITYFSSETNEFDFADYFSRMPWQTPLHPDGQPKFQIALRDKDWSDVIQPDGINIVDWLNMGDAFYSIGDVLQDIKSQLKSGIALVAIQKDPHKELGMGGMWSEHLASLYLTLDFERLTVKKAKKWHTWNPNGKSMAFKIIDRGAAFSEITLLKKCNQCYNGKVRGVDCLVCHGSGMVPDLGDA